MLLKLDIPITKGSSPMDVFLNKVKLLVEAAIEEDNKTQLLPWDLDKPNNNAGIIDASTIHSFPKSREAFMPYSQHLRVRAGSTVWVKLHWARDRYVERILSSSECAFQWWYDENNGGAFPCTVQNSANTVDLGDFLYSGAFINTDRLTEVIQVLYMKHYKKEAKFGLRVRKSKDAGTKDKSEFKAGHWALDDSKVIHVEVDKKQTQALLSLIKITFNGKSDRMGRPGYYGLRFLPEKNLVKSGTRGSQSRANMMKKHQAVVQSLSLINSESIKELDKSMEVSGRHITLRRMLLEIPFPLVPKGDKHPNNQSSFMFHSIDMARTGNDAVEGVMYATSYHDRADIAEKLIEILPKYVERQLGSDAMEAWFHAIAIESTPIVHFECDDDGNWLGSWTTDDDKKYEELMDEDMGIDIKIDGLELMSENQPKVMLTSEAASLKSVFGANGILKELPIEETSSESDSSSIGTIAVTQMGDGSGT